MLNANWRLGYCVPLLAIQPGICHTQSINDASWFFLGTCIPLGCVLSLEQWKFFPLHRILNAVILTEIKCMEKINDLISSCCCQKKCKRVFDLVALKK